MSDTGTPNLTPKQTRILEELEELSKENVHPTVRSLADRLETRTHRSERFSDDEVRGLLERLEEKGQVQQVADGGVQRYRLAQ